MEFKEVDSVPKDAVECSGRSKYQSIIDAAIGGKRIQIKDTPEKLKNKRIALRQRIKKFAYPVFCSISREDGCLYVWPKGEIK